MATVHIKDSGRTLTDAAEISAFLAPFGIWYRRFEGSDSLGEHATDEEILTAYKEPIDQLMAEGAYQTADVINISADTPNLDAMLDKFNKEHWHDENEVRFMVGGRGLFHIHPTDGPVFSIEVVAGDMINVPRGTHHWFDLCADRTIRAIRLFEDPSGWTPHYTDSGEETRHEPLCFGPQYLEGGPKRVPQRPLMGEPLGVRGVLVDIEGTTTPISFVYDVLFPFARERLAEACAEASDRPEVAAAVEQLRGEYAAEIEAGDGELPAFGDGSSYAEHLMASDRKSTGLKALQGLIWRAGYGDGSLRGVVFPDVPEALASWRETGVQLRVFSSGSVLAQKLLFSTTEHGDLTRLFEGYHDTTTGPKQESESYRRIAHEFRLEPNDILFLSDVQSELDAAGEAGMRTGLLERPGNPTVSNPRHSRYVDFAELVHLKLTGASPSEREGAPMGKKPPPSSDRSALTDVARAPIRDRALVEGT